MFIVCNRFVCCDLVQTRFCRLLMTPIPSLWTFTWHYYSNRICLSMEVFSSRRWRLYRPKQNAVLFMSNLKRLCNTCMAYSIIVWLLGRSSCSSPSTKELHGLFSTNSYAHRGHIILIFQLCSKSDREFESHYKRLLGYLGRVVLTTSLVSHKLRSKNIYELVTTDLLCQNMGQRLAYFVFLSLFSNTILQQNNPWKRVCPSNTWH